MSLIDYPRRRLPLSLIIDDPEVVNFLGEYEESERSQHASLALRIGVLAMGQARGAIDVQAVHREGEWLVANVRDALNGHASMVSQCVGERLAAYLDPNTGLLPQRLQQLTAEDGELARVVGSLVAGDDSAVAKTLAAHVGASSPLLKKLDPAQRDGLVHTLEQTIQDALQAQHKRIAGEFTLDDPESALSRLIRELTTSQGELQQGLSGDVDQLRRLLSLDEDDSALSRLVRKVEQAQAGIVDQFSLDSENSALSRLKKELHGTLSAMQQNQAAFQGQVLELLTRLDERQKVERQGTLHGHRFEDALGARVRAMSDGAGDLAEHTGHTTGRLNHCKKGDLVVTLGPERVGAGRSMVWEAKQNASYSDAQALAELEEARKNRGADVGVFVYSRSSFPDAKTFRRFGNHLLVVWDAEDPASDVVLECAYSVGLALLAAAASDTVEVDVDMEAVDAAILAIEKQADRMQKIRGKCDSIRNAAGWIDDEARKIGDNLRREAGRLRDQAVSLRTAFASDGGAA